RELRQTAMGAWEGWGLRWLNLSMLMVSTLSFSRLAAVARQELRAQLAARRTSVSRPRGRWLATLLRRVRADSAQLGWRCEARDYLWVLARQLWRLTPRRLGLLFQDAPGRAVLAFNVLAHVSLAYLLLTLAWTWYAS
ncbi:MAG: hypothetical protein ACRD9R_04115, partial [Pyrinomonadaceae bacterium]